MLSQAILAGASAQIRNMATNAGNLNQLRNSRTKTGAGDDDVWFQRYHVIIMSVQGFDALQHMNGLAGNFLDWSHDFNSTCADIIDEWAIKYGHYIVDGELLGKRQGYRKRRYCSYRTVGRRRYFVQRPYGASGYPINIGDTRS